MIFTPRGDGRARLPFDDSAHLVVIGDDACDLDRQCAGASAAAASALVVGCETIDGAVRRQAQHRFARELGFAADDRRLGDRNPASVRRFRLVAVDPDARIGALAIGFIAA